jgi:Fur family transcriptional regulator, ferric uptake regulator
MAESPSEPFVEAARRYWRERKRPWTLVRALLCRHLAEAEGAVNAEELLRRARLEDRQISRASVYRFLADLREAGLVRAVPTAGDEQAFVVVRAASDGISSIVCLDCDRTVPLEDQCLPLREGFLARRQGFTPTTMKLEIRAHCERKRAGECEHA